MDYEKALKSFCANYTMAAGDTEATRKTLEEFTKIFYGQLRSPHKFDVLHKRMERADGKEPFGIRSIKPLILWEHSRFVGKEQLSRIQTQVDAGENVLFLANHQTEPDPQLLSLLLSKEGYKKLADEMIFVAGHRVTTDPIAVPFSLECNLLCIYSKRHIDHPPEQRAAKRLHNQRAMKTLHRLLMEGGKCIYVAPAGGRDRPDETGEIQVAQFDSSSLKLFQLLAKKTARPTHFYPLALYTHAILPPPKEVLRDLGEERLFAKGPVRINLGKEWEESSLEGILERVRELYEEIRS